MTQCLDLTILTSVVILLGLVMPWPRAAPLLANLVRRGTMVMGVRRVRRVLDRRALVVAVLTTLAATYLASALQGPSLAWCSRLGRLDLAITLTSASCWS